MLATERDSRQLINLALRLHATDIHFHPLERKTLLLFRIHGRLHRMGVLNSKETERLIAHFKFCSGMDIGEKRRPQNAAVLLKDTLSPVNLRFSTMPALYRESLSIRLLPQFDFFSLKTISFDSRITTFFRSLLREKQGIIMLTGPTGAGKTSTLYTFMNEITRHYMSRVVSMEDPIEIRSDHFIQTEINEKAGLTYSELLKSSLRHDPDVLMVGEVRDKETAHLAIRAALTGHLVLTTMHASSPQGAIKRLLDYNLPPLDLEETLLCITSQTLLPRQCPFCSPFVCSPYCQMNKRKSRAALFDVLAKKELKKAVSCPDKQTLTFSREQQLKKGVALGLFREVYMEAT